MIVQIVEIPGAYLIVDASVPGGRTLAQHAERERAEAAAARFTSPAPAPTLATPLPKPPVQEEQAPKSEPSVLPLDLSLSVGEVLKRIPGVDSLVVLEALRAAEASGRGRKTVLAALARRSEELLSR